MSVIHETYLKAILENRKNTAHWTKFKEDNQTLKESLKYFSKRYKPKIMVPIGKKAFMKGHLVHTDEILVALGDSYFLKSNSNKAIDICERRIKEAEEMLEKCEKESKLFESRIKLSQDVFGNNECKEIIEPFDEEEDKNWRLKHREKEREYKQQLKEIKESGKSKLIENEKDLWDRLDALELQEELTDELHRLGFSDDEDEETASLENINEERDSDDLSSVEEDNGRDEAASSTNNRIVELEEEPNRTIKKTVRFAEESNTSNTDEENCEASTSSSSLLSSSNGFVMNAISESVVERIPETTLTVKSERPVSRFKSSKNK